MDEPPINKGASSDSWKSRPRNEQQNRVDKQGIPSPSSTERNSEMSDNWRTVEKKRPNP
jgi:hypothetical protein